MKLLIYPALLLTLIVGCKEKTSLPNQGNSVFAKGADVGWLTQMEAAGIKFYNRAGEEQDCMQILKDLGMNSIRLRVWVHPTDGWNNTKDVVAKAKRAKNLGMQIMIDFHYSDNWADPGKQYKPAAWVSLSFDSLVKTVHTYTKGVMDTLIQNDITPTWVQVGNETRDGMLWEDGRASKSMSNFSKLINAGYAAIKEASPSSLVIVHIDNGYDNNLYHWVFDGLKENQTNFDIIGMSLYPSYAPDGVNGWSNVNYKCLLNMNDMVARYHKPVMIVEVGMPYDKPDLAKSFLADIITRTKSVDQNMGLGVFYWEPESYNNWQGYTLGSFDNTGKPTTALDAFAN
ncbi:MAG TPA: arabinogalactan endo-1,4-beta-galactosidase [Cytophagales bacterium]|jgi:arabinogalactan endo-1,4-beta-galactosidase|nr:arabinogalactan endo-1,4-beta-galactosidase [Cytophagales bacterium]